MNKLDLNDYSDKEIVSAIFALKPSKFLPVLGALAQVLDELKVRGEKIADESDDVVENMIKQLFGDEQ